MTLNEQYVRACHPDRRKILGRELRDFCAGYAELLDLVGFNAGEIRPADLLVAIGICSLPLHRARRYARAGGWQAWQLAALLLFRLRPETFHAAGHAFQEYIAAAHVEVRVWSDKASTRKSSCPALLMAVRDLTNHYGYSEDEALEMPLGKAEFQRLAILESAGALDFFTDEDQDFITEALKIAQQEFEERQRAKETNGSR